MFEERFGKIKEKLNELEFLMPQFGEKIIHHVYRRCYPVNPPATVEQIAAFEHSFNCSLPDDYRAFIQQVGDGGPGSHAIAALCRENNKTGNPYKVVRLAPFPFKWQFIMHEGEEHGPFMVYRDDLTEVEENMDLAMEISCDGCDIYNFLILSGEEKGTVWWAWIEHDGACNACQIGELQRVSFLEWYEDWLEKALQEARRGPQKNLPIYVVRS